MNLHSQNFSHMRLHWGAQWFLLFAFTALLSACDRTPVYSGLYVTGFDYTHRSITNIIVEDEFGNGFATGGPGGEGSLSCCEKIQGTNVKVKWTYSHRTAQDYRDRKPEETREVSAKMPPITDLPKGKAKMRIFEVHIFPDEHVELALTDEMFERARFPQYEVARRLLEDPQLRRWDAMLEESGANYWLILYQFAGDAYRKYGLSNVNDLEQYVRMAVKISPSFDTHSIVAPLIKQTKGKPGQFAEAIKSLTEQKIEEIRAANPAVPPTPEDAFK